MDSTEREMYELVCKGRLTSIEGKLDKLLDRNSDINVRLTCLEQTKQSASHAFWIAVTAIVMTTIIGIKDFFSGK